MFKVSRLIDVDLNSQIQIPLRRLLNEAFEDDFSEEDWQHTHGGVRFLGHLDGHLISHGAVVPRTIEVDESDLIIGSTQNSEYLGRERDTYEKFAHQQEWS